MGKVLDITGKIYGKLTVICFIETRKRKAHWKCNCECGKTIIVKSNSLNNGSTKSCGCKYKEANSKRLTTHGMTNSSIFNLWKGMIQRCSNPNSTHFKNYGGRGITVCNRWLDFKNFYSDMGEKPTNKTLDRIDVNGNYCPENCWWATAKQQANNKRNNRIITFNGKSQSLMQWSTEKGINRCTLSDRLNSLNWSIGKALTTPTMVR